MTQDDVADVLLRALYDHRDDDLTPEAGSLAAERGVTDSGAVYRATLFLFQKGLIEDYSEASAGHSQVHQLCRISGKAIRIIELIGPDQSIIEYLDKANSSTGIYIQGISNSNLAISSPLAKQSVRVGADVSQALAKMVNALQHDPALSEEERASALEDAESLQTLLEKPKPNNKVLRFLLGSLATVGSAAEYIEHIKGALGLG